MFYDIDNFFALAWAFHSFSSPCNFIVIIFLSTFYWFDASSGKKKIIVKVEKEVCIEQKENLIKICFIALQMTEIILRMEK